MQNQSKNASYWQRNLLVLWFGTFMIGIGFSIITPFMSFYIEELGNFTTKTLNLYAGMTFSVTFLVSTFTSPLWGRLADRKGRKLMLLRTSLGMAIVLSLMGCVGNVWQLIALRALQGVFSGFIANANALVATQTPRVQSGRALGILVTGITSGTLIGPLFGGLLADMVGYRAIFFITGSILFLVFLLSLFLIKEDFQPVFKTGKTDKNGNRSSVMKELPYPRMVLGLVITTMIIQASNNSINPILSLYVRNLVGGGGNIAFQAGLVAAIPGVATIIFAPLFGKWGDAIGTHRLLLVGFCWASVVFFLTGFATDITHLLLLRFFIGISDATMLPAVNTLLAKNTPPHMTGRIFSYNQSFQAMGNVLGPMIGTTMSSLFGYSAVFFSTTVLVLLNMSLFWFNSKKYRATQRAK